MARLVNSTGAPGSGDPGRKWGRCTIGGVGSVKNAWRNLPQVLFVAVRFPWRVRLGIAVCRECRHHALGFSSPARGFFAVVRLARLDGTVAGRGIDLYSSVSSTVLAVSRHCFQEPFSRLLGGVYSLYLMAQFEESVRFVALKGEERL